ncbi:MAG TPA: hypothetical protein PK691_08450, partial [Thermomicrobiales bacterium]|nr:hypothetical protein [Thermomicrobiales bacterium]
MFGAIESDALVLCWWTDKARSWTVVVAVLTAQAGTPGTTARWQGVIIVQGSLLDGCRGRAD